MRAAALLALAAACATAPEPGAPTTAAPGEAAATLTGASPPIQAAPGGDAVLAEDLRVLCDGLDAVQRDASRPLPERLRELEHSVREADPARGERIDDLLTRPPGPTTTGPQWARAIRERAAAQGVPMPPGTCPALEPILEEAAGARFDGVSFAEDLARLCTVVAEVQAEEPPATPEERAMRVAERLDAVITHPVLREMLDAAATVEAAVRYDTFRGWVLADPSVERSWSCPPLAAAWAPG